MRLIILICILTIINLGVKLFFPNEYLYLSLSISLVLLGITIYRERKQMKEQKKIESDISHLKKLHSLDSTITLSNIKIPQEELIGFRKTDIDKFEFALTKASKYIKEKCLAEAEKILDAIITKHEFPTLIHNYGNLSFYKENYEDAIGYYKKAIDLGSKNPITRLNLAITFNTLGLNSKNHEKAVSFLQDAIKVKKDFFGAYYNLGTSYAKRGEEEALYYLTKALEINPRSVKTMISLAQYYCLVKDIAMARYYFDEAFKLDNKNSELWNSYGVFLITIERDVDQARICFSYALEINPNFIEAAKNLNKVHSINESSMVGSNNNDEKTPA